MDGRALLDLVRQAEAVGVVLALDPPAIFCSQRSENVAKKIVAEWAVAGPLFALRTVACRLDLEARTLDFVFPRLLEGRKVVIDISDLPHLTHRGQRFELVSNRGRISVKHVGKTPPKPKEPPPTTTTTTTKALPPARPGPAPRGGAFVFEDELSDAHRGERMLPRDVPAPADSTRASEVPDLGGPLA